jgi:hypothetical protein
MDYDTGMFAKERHANLLREVKASRLAASLTRQQQHSIVTLAQRVLTGWRNATARTRMPRPTRSAWQAGEE